MVAVDAFDVIRTDSAVAELARLLSTRQDPVAATGLWGSFAPILAATISRRLDRPLLLVTAREAVRAEPVGQLQR